MTAAARPFQLTLPDGMPFEVLYPGITLSPESRPEHHIAARRLGVEKQLQEYAESVRANPHLSFDGQISRWTEKAAVPALRLLQSDRKDLVEMEAAVLGREAGLVAREVAKLPGLPDAERVALVEAFRGADSEVKRRAMAAASNGKDPMLARAISETHPLLSGLEEFEMEALRAGMLEQLDQTPAVSQERMELQERVVHIRSEFRAVDNLIKAILAQVDGSALPADVFPRKSEMTREEQVLFMLDHGQAAFAGLRE